MYSSPDVIHDLVFFFFNDTATTEIYPLSLHDALPIFRSSAGAFARATAASWAWRWRRAWRPRDRKSTRLNSSHSQISYAVFCLKKKKHRGVNYGGGLSAGMRTVVHVTVLESRVLAPGA